MRLATVRPLSGRPHVRCRADHAKQDRNVVIITMFRFALHVPLVGEDSAGDSFLLRMHRHVGGKEGIVLGINAFQPQQVLTIEARTGPWAREGWRE
jgi:hypothetical protein